MASAHAWPPRMAVRSSTHAVPVDGRSSALDNADVSVEPSTLVGLQHRRDFLAAAKARKAVTDGFILQRRARRDDSNANRVGFTASKKVGNAVVRNRAKRRLRALAREILSLNGDAGCDYVLIARKATTVGLPFQTLSQDLTRAIERSRASKSR